MPFHRLDTDSWTERDGPTASPQSSRARKLKRVGEGSTLFYTTEAPNGTGRTSTDRGESWTDIPPPAGFPGCIDYGVRNGVAWGAFYDSDSDQCCIARAEGVGSWVIKHTLAAGEMVTNLDISPLYSKVAVVYHDGTNYTLCFSIDDGATFESKVISAMSVDIDDTPLIHWVGQTRIVVTVPSGDVVSVAYRSNTGTSLFSGISTAGFNWTTFVQDTFHDGVRPSYWLYFLALSSDAFVVSATLTENSSSDPVPGTVDELVSGELSGFHDGADLRVYKVTCDEEEFRLRVSLDGSSASGGFHYGIVLGIAVSVFNSADVIQAKFNDTLDAFQSGRAGFAVSLTDSVPESPAGDWVAPPLTEEISGDPDTSFFGSNGHHTFYFNFAWLPPGGAPQSGAFSTGIAVEV